VGLIIPSVFANSLAHTGADFSAEAVKISRATAVMLLVAYLVYVYLPPKLLTRCPKGFFISYLFFQAKSHHGLYDEILEADEHKDADRHRDLAKEKLTFTECLLALAIAIACVSMIAVFLVDQIEFLVKERHVSDAFLGLILVPLVEKAAEHLTAIDEAWDNQANFALAHVLGASIQTALLNTPLVVIVGWGLGHPMDLNFEIFDAAVLILAIIVVGNFLRDGKSNYLEGFLCVTVYIIIAVTAFYYPNPEGEETVSEAGAEPAAESPAPELIRRMIMG
jgi:Ca2+:H+ antiporter